MSTPDCGNGRPDHAIDGAAGCIQRINAEQNPVKALGAACEEVAKAEPGNVQQMAALHLKMGLDYYLDVRRQSQQSFIVALVAAVVGTLFFLGAAWSILADKTSHLADIGVIAGTVIQVIAAISFYLYLRTARQFALFHVCLERTNRFMLAYSMCQNLKEDRRDEALLQLIDLIANAPILTVEMTAPARNRRTSPTHAQGGKQGQSRGQRNNTSKSGSDAEPSATADPGRR